MADKKFTQLTAAAALAAADLFAIAQSPFGAGTSKSITAQKVLDFVNTNGSFLKLSGGDLSGDVTFNTTSVVLRADGSASFATGVVTIAADGETGIGGVITLFPNGAASFAAGGISFATDGSAFFAANNFSIGPGGSLDIGAGLFNFDVGIPGIGFFNAGAQAQQSVDGTLVNNVSSAGSTDNIVDDIQSGGVLATDVASLASTQGAVYQLARKLKLVTDALRTYGIVT
jgi:hypothetical protein